MITNWSAKMPAIQEIFASCPDAGQLIEAESIIMSMVYDENPTRAVKIAGRLIKFHPVMAEYRQQLAMDRLDERDDLLLKIRDRRSLRRVVGNAPVDELKQKEKQAKESYWNTVTGPQHSGAIRDALNQWNEEKIEIEKEYAILGYGSKARYDAVIGVTEFSDVPPCLESLTKSGFSNHLNKYPEQITENRNINLHKIACSLFVKGLSSEAVWVAIEKENETKCAEPLPKAELMQLFKSAGKFHNKTLLEQSGTQENLTDLGNAERLVRAYGEIFRYCSEFKKWLLWDGTRWVMDTPAGVKPLAYKTVRNMAVEAQGLTDERRTALIKHSLSSESKRALDAMVSLAEAVRGVPIRQSELDTNPDYLNAVNGTINLKSGLLRHHDPTDYITRRVSVEYNQFAQCPTWEKFIHRIFDGNEETMKYVQKAVGYSLTGSTEEQCIFIPHGGGMNGKSKFLEAIEYILSDYASHCSADTLMVKHTQGGASSEIARLRGARFVAAVETDEGKRMSESLVKELTGGDTITARFLFSEHFEFIPTFKMWLACNHKPVIRGTDFAIWRRIKLIPFTVTIPKEEQDKKLGEKLRAEAAGILAWAVKGCMMWREEGLNDTAEIAEATAGYKLEMDSLGTWLDSMCVIVRGAESKASVLYENYKTWAEESGEYVQSMRGFGQKLGERGFQKINKNTGVHYIGLGLKADQDIKY